ncbi:MAG: trypsin-like peptidase domain-containing protein [Limisphaerales bacterium]
MNRIRSLALSVIVSAGLIGNGAVAFAKDSSALELARQLNEAFVEVADKVSPAVVVITVTQKANYHGSSMEDNGDDSSSPWEMLPPELRRYFEEWGNRGNRGGNRGNRRQQRVPQMQGEGSGIVISEDGYILTNNHVVDGAEKIHVRFKNGEEYDATVKGTDPESDVAVVKIKPKSHLLPAKLGDSDKTRVGEFAIAIGAPFQLTYSVTVGHISAKGRSGLAVAASGYADQDFLQTDASINPGNSGGPLVNLYGEVIGINAMIRGMNTGIGFAIPINLAKRVTDHLISEGKFVRSWIGVGIQDLKDDADLRDLDPKLRPDVEEGVVIRTKQKNGPAYNSDLKPFDVVVAIDGKKVSTPRQLQEEVSGKKPGQTITLDVVRNHNQHVAVKIKTAALPSDLTKDDRSNQNNGNSDEPASFGLSVENLNKDNASKYDIEGNQQGVVVTAVEPGSVAEESGLKAGDVITDVNRKPVTSVREFHDATKGVNAKSGAIFNVVSNGTSKFLVLKDRE